MCKCHQHSLETTSKECYQGNYRTKASYWISWSQHFESCTETTMTWLTVVEYLCCKWPRICSTCRKHFPTPSLFMTCHRVCYYINTTGATSGVRVPRTLVLCVYFVDHCLPFWPFLSLSCLSFFDLRILLPIWYLQTLLTKSKAIVFSSKAKGNI